MTTRHELVQVGVSAFLRLKLTASTNVGVAWASGNFVESGLSTQRLIYLSGDIRVTEREPEVWHAETVAPRAAA